MDPDVEGAQEHDGRGLIRTERPLDDAGVRQGRVAQGGESLGQDAFELGENLRARVPATHLHGILHLLAEAVPDVLVGWHLDPRVPLPRQPGLDADDMRDLVVHRPSGAVGGSRQVVIAAGMGKIHDGLGGAGEGFDEVVQPLRWCQIWRHVASLPRLWA